MVAFHITKARSFEKGKIMSEENDQSKLSRRRFLEAGSAVLVAAAGLQAQGQQSRIYPTDTHTGVNESQPGPNK